MKSVIFLTTRTSATGSMWRTINALAKGKYAAIRVDNLGRANGEEEDAVAIIKSVSEFVPPTEDHVILWNNADHFNFNLNLSNYKFIINARDPRDLVVNKYWWEFSHPTPGKGFTKSDEKLDRFRQNGIDKYVLSRRKLPEFAAIERVVGQLAPEDWTFIGYALYCLHFDDAVAKMAALLDVDLSSLKGHRRELIDAERTENLSENKRWIGQVFEGSDTAPGRHRRELQPETIARLTEQHAQTLSFLRRIDDPRVASFYD